jgi:hypothetical protein
MAAGAAARLEGFDDAGINIGRLQGLRRRLHWKPGRRCHHYMSHCLPLYQGSY